MDELTKLLEGGYLDQEAVDSLKAAIDAKVNERLDEEKQRIRDEFAKRYEHDKDVMIEAANKMFSDVLKTELKEFHEQRNELIESKVQYKKKLREHMEKMHDLVSSVLHKEVEELREDRKDLSESIYKFQEFATNVMREELEDFHAEKRQLIETKVKILKEGKAQIESAKKRFIKNASVLAEEHINDVLRKELSSLREDVKEAKKNRFGRQLFEAFAAEFMASHASDGTKLKELAESLKAKERELAEIETRLVETKKQAERAQRHAKLVESKMKRQAKMNELLSPLSDDKKEIMAELLENVQTDQLDRAFKKHIGFVLRENVNEVPNLNENLKTVDGSNTLNESNKGSSDMQSENFVELDIARIKRLSGL